MSLLLDLIKADLLNEERMLVRENRTSKKTSNALQVYRGNERSTQRNKPRTLEEKVRFAEWVKTAQCRCCKQVGHIKATCPAKLKSQNQANQVMSPGNNTVETTQAEAKIELDALQATLEGDASTYLASNTLP